MGFAYGQPIQAVLLGVDDFVIPPEKSRQSLLKQSGSKKKSKYNYAGCLVTQGEKYNKVSIYGSRTNETFTEAMMKKLSKRNGQSIKRVKTVRSTIL